MRMGNPSVSRWMAKSQRGELGVEVTPATYKGVYGKTALLGAITMVMAILTELFLLKAINDGNYDVLVFAGIAAVVCAIPMLIIALIIAFAPSTTKVLGIIYSVMQGALLGALSLFVDLFYPGIAFAAFLGTAIVFVISVAINKLMEVRISSKFMRGLMIAFVSLLLVELVMWIMSLCGVFVNFMTYVWIQLIVSAVCIIWATIMLLWDLQNIDYCVQTGCDKRYEWNLAFSLVTTLVYMYLKILELLIRLAAVFGKKK